jgi:DNA-binding transcriptional regulator YhcF (GntR family)
VAQPDSDRFASRRLAGILRTEIAGGAYPPGTRLPSYRQLRDEHHVALNTAQAAIRILAVEGLVEIRPARGAYVREGANGGAAPTLRAELTDLQAALRRSRRNLGAAENAVADILTRLPPEEPGG